MKELIEWIMGEINAGADAARIYMKLEMLLRVAEKCPSYYLTEIVKALAGGDEDA